MPDPTSARVFVSYSRKDGAAFAADLCKKLRKQDLSIWRDLVALEGGRDWWSQIEEAIRSKALQHFVLVVTPAALASPVVRREIRLARQEGKTVSPVKGPGLGELGQVPRWLGQVYDLDLPEHFRTLIRVLQDQSRQKRVPMTAPEPPVDFVRRLGEFQALKAKLLDPKGDAVAISAALKGAGVWNAAAQTLARQDAEFGFGHVEPASVFGGVVPFEPFGEAARFWRGKGRVERGGRVRAQIVLDQPDLFGVGKMHVGQFLEHLRVIGGGVAVGDLDAAPALQRRENHEYIGYAVSLVFVIVPDGSSGCGRNRSARLDDQLLGGFIQTDEGAIGIARLLVSIQHVFHRGDEAGVGVRRNHPLPIAVGLEDVFFRSYCNVC